MTDLETRLRERFATHEETVRVDDGLLDAAVRRGERRIRRRRASIAVAAMVMLLSSGLVLEAVLDDDLANVAISSSTGQWTLVDTTDPGIFTGEGDTFITAITPWEDRLVVLGVLQPQTGGENAVIAWVTGDGLDWERHELAWPDGCDPYGGLVARGDELIVSCTVDDGGTIGVASTTDLARWTVRSVAEGGDWFGSLVGAGPEGTVVMQALEAEAPNTTVGVRTRIWSSDDLVTWTEIGGQGVDTFLDAHVTTIRSFGNHVVLTGMVNEWPADPGSTTAAISRPSVWVSTGGGPFERVLVDPGDAFVDGAGVVMDVASTGSGFIAVGSAGKGSTGLAWRSKDLSDWTAVDIVGSEGPTASVVPPQSALWAVIDRSDNTLLAAGSDPRGANTMAWQSTDDGRSWQGAGPGPSLIANWDEIAVGTTSFPDHPGFWIWGPRRPTREAQALLHNAGPLEGFEPGVLVEVPLDDGSGLFVRRRGDGTIAVLSRRDPRSGCRIVTRAELPREFPELDAIGALHDPCKGSTYRADGSSIGGPSVRGLFSYDAAVVEGDVIVDLSLAYPGAFRGDLEGGVVVVDRVGTTDDVARGWLDAFRVVLEELSAQSGPRNVVGSALGAFHDPSTGIVTVAFTLGQHSGKFQIGPAGTWPKVDTDKTPVLAEITAGTLFQISVPDKRTGLEVAVNMNDGREARAEVVWPVGLIEVGPLYTASQAGLAQLVDLVITTHEK